MNTRLRRHHRLDRRSFLRGASALGAVGLALPALPSLGHAQQGAAPPKRLVVFFSGNGTIASSWSPMSDNGTITGLSPILEPLRPHLQDLTVIEGLDLTCGKHTYQPRGGFHAHERGIGGILTGQHLNEGAMEAMSGYANGISLDQFVADGLQGETDLHSLQVGLCARKHGKGWFNRDTMTYQGPNKPLLAESDGSKLFTRIFGEGSGEPAALRRTRARRRSVLDFVRDDLRRVEAQVSMEDRRRLEQHTEAFRTLEKQLEAGEVSCTRTEDPSTIDNWYDDRKMDAVSDFQIKQTVQALACDRTRVATIQFGKGLGALSLRCIGHDDGWHTLSHEGDSNGTARRKLTELNTYIAGRFAKLLEEMKAVPEGNGTLLDHSVVLWVNELGKGNNHEHKDVPIVMAGSLGGHFRTGGRHVRFGERNTNDLLITLCQAFGHRDVTHFGIRELCQGPLTELLI